MGWDYDALQGGLVRIIPWRNRISIEVSHIISDGTGALALLTALTEAYLGERRGDQNLSAPTADYCAAEWEDAFARFYNRKLPFRETAGRAFRPQTSLLPVGQYRVISGIVKTGDIKAGAAAWDLKIGEYLVALLMDSMQDLSEFSGIIRILVPVDLRRFFPSKTLRNFFSFVAPEIDCRFGKLDFSELALEVRTQMRGALVARKLLARFSSQVRLQHNSILRIIPGPFKRLILSLGFPVAAEARYSASLSNLGAVALSEASAPNVRRFTFTPPPSPWTRTNCSVISWGSETVISFGSTDRSRELERVFFRKLRDGGARALVFGGTP